MIYIKQLVTYLALLWPISAMAFIDPPSFSPQPALANQPIVVSIRRGDCDVFPTIESPTDIPYEVIQVAPNRVQLYVRGVHKTEQLFCFGPASIGTVEFPLPLLATGQYQFELYVRNVARPGTPIYNGPVASFAVVGQSAALTPVPGLNLWGMTALLLGGAGVAMFGTRSK